MAIEPIKSPPARRGLSVPATVVLGALAIFGAITAVQWVLTSLLGIVKLGLIIVVVLGVAAWVMSAKANR